MSLWPVLHSCQKKAGRVSQLLLSDCSPPLVTMVFLTQKYLDLNRWSWEDPIYFGGFVSNKA